MEPPLHNTLTEEELKLILQEPVTKVFIVDHDETAVPKASHTECTLHLCVAPEFNVVKDKELVFTVSNTQADPTCLCITT